MPSKVVDVLKTSSIQNIQAVGRRGITHAQCTQGYVKEVSEIPGIELYMMRDEVQRSMTTASEAEMYSTFAK